MNTAFSISLVVLGLLCGYAGVFDLFKAKMIFQQIGGELEILIGVVLVLGGLILDRIPSNKSLFQNQKNSPRGMWTKDHHEEKLHTELGTRPSSPYLSSLCKPGVDKHEP